MVNIPFDSWGIAKKESETFADTPLFSGNGPFNDAALETYLAPAADVPAFAVVGRITASGKIVQSVRTAVDGSQNPIGVTVAKIFVKTPNADTSVRIWKSGTFNPDALAWDASWATDEQKRLAFETANKQIQIQKIG